MLKASTEVVLEGETFDPCQSNRFYTIELKIGDSDYVRPPTKPAKFGEIRISGGAPARRWNIQVRWLLFIYFFLFSDARPDQTRRPIWAHSTSKDAVSRKDESFGGKKYTGYKFRGVLPQKPPKFPPGIGFPMLNSKSNCERTVRDRKVISSANPTKSRTANPTKVMSLTLDWPLTYFSRS